MKNRGALSGLQPAKSIVKGGERILLDILRRLPIAFNAAAPLAY